MWAFGDLWAQWLSFTSTSWWNQTVGCTTPNKFAHFLIKSSHANMEISRMGFSSQSYLQSEATAPTSFQISLKLRFILQIFVNMCHKFELLMWYLFRFFWQLMAIQSGPVVCMRKLPQELHSFEITPAGKFEDCRIWKLWHNHLIKSIMRSTNTYYTGTLLIVVILSTWTWTWWLEIYSRRRSFCR